MRKNYLLILLFIFIPLSSVQAYQFTRNLSIGDQGQDVLELQRVLNSDTKTQVASFGVGSPGNETNYFGSLTRSAVIRFQNLYYNEILKPVNLISGTGYVGPSTRSKLNQQNTIKIDVPVAEKIDIQPSNTTSELNSVSFLSTLDDLDELLLFYPSKHQGKAGDSLSLTGAGFEANNTVYFGTNSIKNITSSGKGRNISISIPDIAKGLYYLAVENSKGKTDTDAFFIIKDPSTKDPKITDISGSSFKYGDEITMSGTGFTNSNDIRTSYGMIKGISSVDGKTLTFKIEPFPESMSEGSPEGVESINWTIAMSIVNDNGISNQITFTLEF